MVRLLRRFYPSIALALLSVVVLHVGSGYRFGSLSRMGPGFFPVLLAWLLLGLSFVQLLAEARRESPSPTIDGKAVTVVAFAMLLFAWSAPWAGMLIAAAVSSLLVMALYDKPRWPGKIIYSILASLALGAIFVLLLRINMPLMPSW